MNSVIEFWNDPLRLTLLVAGVIVILAIYAMGRRGSRHSRGDLKVPNLSEQDHNTHTSVSWDNVDEAEGENPGQHSLGLSAAEISSALELEADSNVGAVKVVKKISEITPAAPEPAMLKQVNVQSASLAPHANSVQLVDNVNQADDLAATVNNIRAKPPPRQARSMLDIPQQVLEQVQAVSAQAMEKERSSTQEQMPSDDESIIDREPAVQDFFAILHVVAKDERFAGKALQAALDIVGLQYGERGIFHFNSDDGCSHKSCFSLANMVKPGSFDLRTMDTFETSGVSLFMRLPGPSDGLRTFSNMLVIAQALARRLKGSILDEYHCPLNSVTITKLRAEVAAFDALMSTANAPEMMH